MRKSNREVNGEKVFRYSIRKYHFGAASVAVAALMFFANGAVKADTLPVSPVTANTEKVGAGVTDLTEGVPLEKSLETEGNKEIVAPDPEEETSNKEDGAGSNAQGEKEIKVSDKAVLTTNQTEEINKAETNIKEEAIANKDKLEALLNEIDKLNLKTYTEDTVKVLQEKVAKAKEVLVNAKTQKEIDLAYNALVGYKNAGLKRVPKPKGELTPKPDTTNGKATVGIKAENTEPNGTNIAGHNHSLNGTTLPEGSGFRTETTNGLSIEVTGDTTFRPGDYLNYNSKYVLMKLKYDKNQYGEKPTFAITGTPNVGIQFESSNPYRDKKKFYNREEGYVSGYLRGTIPKEMIGKYNMLIHMKYNANGVTTTLKFPIEVKPDTPTLKEPIENDGAKYSSLAATTLVGSHSEVKFEVNGQESPWIKASSGEAVYSIEQGFRPGDRVRVKAKAYSDTISVGEHRDKLSPEESESNWSSETILPNFPTPTLNKDGAKNEVNTAFTTKSTQIDSDNTLTDEEKTKLKELAKIAKDNAIQNIENAQDETALNTAKDNGVNAINGVALPAETEKARAIKAVEAAKTTKDTEIDGNNALTTEEKDAAKDQTKQAKDGAVTNINAATTNAEVATAKTNGLNAIESVTTANKVKAAAVSAIDAKVTEKNGQIDRDTTLTTEEKTAQKGSVTSEANKAKTAINNATTNAAVETAKTNGLNAIGSVTTANKVKAAAKADLATIAAEEIKAIKADVSLLASEQAKKEAEVNTKKADGEREIDNAETTDKVAQAKETAKTAIEGVHTPGDLNAVKNAAKAELATAAAEEKAEIAGDKSLTAAQRAEKEKAVDDTKAAEEAKITAADDADKVSTAKTAGVAAIKAVHTVGSLDDVKAAAKALPNTGTVKSTLAIPVAITSALLSLGLVGGRRRKEDEEV